MAQVSVPDPSSFPLFTGNQTRTMQCLLPNQSIPYHHHPQLLPPSARISCHLGHHPIILAMTQVSPPAHICFTSNSKMDAPLLDYNIQKESTLHLVLCL